MQITKTLRLETNKLDLGEELLNGEISFHLMPSEEIALVVPQDREDSPFFELPYSNEVGILLTKETAAKLGLKLLAFSTGDSSEY